jgi:hypothetical protein
MFRYGDKCRQQKLFNLEQHAITDVTQVFLQEGFTLFFFEDILLRKFLNDYQNCDFCFFFNFFCFLMF